eukprot:811559-Alexandrium_andersonii.AAC.1
MTNPPCWPCTCGRRCCACGQQCYLFSMQLEPRNSSFERLKPLCFLIPCEGARKSTVTNRFTSGRSDLSAARDPQIHLGHLRFLRRLRVNQRRQNNMFKA